MSEIETELSIGSPAALRPSRSTAGIEIGSLDESGGEPQQGGSDDEVAGAGQSQLVVVYKRIFETRDADKVVLPGGNVGRKHLLPLRTRFGEEVEAEPNDFASQLRNVERYLLEAASGRSKPAAGTVIGQQHRAVIG